MQNSTIPPENAILKLTFQFAIRVVAFTHTLEAAKRYILAKQLFRSGTSIGANVREAQGAESLSDFIHKVKVAYKESEETMYWLEICERSKNYPNPHQLIKDVQEIKKVLGKIIASSIERKRRAQKGG